MGVHDGHRQRLRERFRREGLDAFAPHEVLELLLIYARARGDVNPLAHALLEAFGSLKGVLEALPEQLMTVPGVGEETATLLALMVPMFRRYERCAQEQTHWLKNRRQAEEYCRSLLRGYRTERFYVICLDAEGHILGQRLIAQGSLAEVHTYPRIVAETALNYNAHSVILCHNHPGGNPSPSQEDIQSTLQLQKVLSGLSVLMLDHLIIGGGEAYSMLQHGLLSGQA